MRRAVLLACLMLFAVLPVLAENVRIGLPAGGRITMSMEYAVPFLKPCSRRGPGDVQGFWVPTDAQLNALEPKLIAFLTSLESDEALPPSTTYHRQYLGFVKHGRRYIYGSFYPGQGKMATRERDNPVRVCDGGSAYWGVVYDPETGEFSDLVVNPPV